MKRLLRYFTKFEIILWSISVAAILCGFAVFEGQSIFNAAASVIGVTSLVLNAKGNPVGQVLMIIFSIFYGIISFGFAYYGEVITYLGMTAPMAAAALISWLRHPFGNNKSQVEVARITGADMIRICISTAAVTFAFYFVLRFFGTENIVLSTVSVATSFAAAYLTYKRSPFFALAYALNDIVLVGLWVLASLSDISYLSVIICFAVFLINDIYGFVNWRKMHRKQLER